MWPDQVLLSKNFHSRPGCRRKILNSGVGGGQNRISLPFQGRMARIRKKRDPQPIEKRPIKRLLLSEAGRRQLQCLRLAPTLEHACRQKKYSCLVEELLCRTSLAPLASSYFLHSLSALETEVLLDFQGRVGITSIARWKNNKGLGKFHITKMRKVRTADLNIRKPRHGKL